MRLAAVDVSGRNNVGGLVGDGTGATIIASSVTGMVNGTDSVGGLVGAGAGATIDASSVTGMVNGENSVGGLLGDGENAMMTDSYSAGDVSGADSVGGLVGDGEGATITASYAAGDVSGTDSVGGLVGDAEGATITASYATGTVSGRNIIGGLVGLGANAMMTASYAAGDVSGTDGVGGLVGNGTGATITVSYAAGDVSGTDSVGGLVGAGAGATITSSYWDSDESGITSGGGEPLSTVQLQVPAEDLRTAWEDQLCPGSVERAWDFGETYQYPALTCPPGGAAAQEEQRTLPAFLGRPAADIVSLMVGDFRVTGANRTEDGLLGTAAGESLDFSAVLSCARGALCAPAVVRYYESADVIVNATDKQVGTSQSPQEGGTYEATITVATGGAVRYYGACVEDDCTAGTRVVLLTDVRVQGARREGSPLQTLRGGDEVTLAVDLFCPGICSVVNLSFYASADDTLDLTDEKIDEQEVSLAPAERRTISLAFPVAYSGYYGVCTPRECFRFALVRLVINNPNDQDDADGVAAAEDVDDDGDGLIEIATADELNNIRFVLDGSGYQAGAVATKDVTGCPPTGCSGYELVASVDLASYGRDYDNGSGWDPVDGRVQIPFSRLPSRPFLTATTFLFTISISIVLERGPHGFLW